MFRVRGKKKIYIYKKKEKKKKEKNKTDELEDCGDCTQAQDTQQSTHRGLIWTNAFTIIKDSVQGKGRKKKLNQKKKKGKNKTNVLEDCGDGTQAQETQLSTHRGPQVRLEDNQGVRPGAIFTTK